MTSLIRWDPFAEFTSLRRAMDRLFDEFMMPSLWRSQPAEMTFPIDVYETDDEVVVKAALPGIRADDVDISVSGESLTIKGEVKQEEKVERENYYRQELRYGAFARTIPLPTRVDHERAEADFADGILTVRLPKAEEVRPKTIKVRARELAGTR